MKRLKTLALFAVALVSFNSSGEVPPVEISYDQPKAGEIRTEFRFKINTSKPIKQVDVAIEYQGTANQVLRNTTFGWQNIINGEQRPIKGGQTYQDKHRFPEGTIKTKASLERVIYEDGSTWKNEKN